MKNKKMLKLLLGIAFACACVAGALAQTVVRK